MKTHYSCAELAAMKLPGMPVSKKGWIELVTRERWEAQKRTGRGGGFEYTPPAKLAKLIAARHHIKQDGHAAAAARAAMAAVKAQTRAEKQAKTKMAVSDMMATLSVNGREKFEANFDIVLAFREYYRRHNSDGQAMRRNEAFAAFSEDYNAGRILISDQVRAKYTRISPRSIQRWVLDNEKNGLVACADRRSVRGKCGRKSTIEQNPDLEKALIAIITEKPHIRNKHLCDIVNEHRLDRETGAIAWESVSYDAICRWRATFEDQNKQALLAVTNPDAWKNRYLSALGKQDEDVLRLNQRWEMDGTPADWMLVGGRHTASVVIDIWSRRPKILFSKTPRTETNKLLLRQAIMEWGVPEEAKTDNGTDYTSRELRTFFEDMGIRHTLSTPFSPWEKPHVERFIKTFLHGLLEMLDSFIGHNVAERKQIEAKRTFAENLFKKNAVVDVDMTVEELQTMADQWVEGIYMPNEHRTLGVSPLEKAASYTGPITRITNERAFDILLAKPAGRMPIITKKGIRYDNATFIHSELPIYVGAQADIRLDPNDLGRLIVYVDGKFICIAECPERTGMDRQEVAAHGRQKQQAFINEKKREYRQARAALPMSTDALVREILVDRAAKAGKVAVLGRRPEAHSTAALHEAERVLQAQEAPPLSAEHAALMEEARQMHAAARNPHPEIIQLPVPHSQSPLEGMTDEAKYDLWLELDGTVRAGRELTESWQQRFHAGFPRTSAYRSIAAMRQMESPSEQQL
jgi:putative transposase